MINCWFMDWVEINSIRYFYSPQLHSLMKVRTNGEKVELEKQLLEAEYFLPGKFITMKCLENKLFLFPLYGKSVCIYDLEQKNVESMELDANTDLGYSIFSSACAKDKIIGIPGRYSRFIIIDKTNKKREIEFDKEKMDEAKVSNSVYFTRGNYVYDNILFIGSLMNNYIVSVSLDYYKVEYYKLECCNEEKKGVYTLCGNEHELYILGNDGKLRIYELLKGDMLFKRVISISPIVLKGGAYANSLYMNGKFIVFSNDGIVICDIDSGKVRKCSLNIRSNVSSIDNSAGFLYAYELNSVIKAMSEINYVEYSFNEDIEVIDEKKYFVNDSELCRLKLSPLIVEENGVYVKSLNFFLNDLKQK